MSYAEIPSIQVIQNGQALDGRELTAAFADLSEMVRVLADDVLGRPCWLSGGDVQAQTSGSVLFAEMSPGDFYVDEPSSMQLLAHRDWQTSVVAGAATRVRQPTRNIELPKNRELMLSIVPYADDARLGALQLLSVTDIPSRGTLPLAWLGTGAIDIHATVDARPHPVYGATVEASGDSMRARSAWTPITDARVALMVFPGERIDFVLHATITDGLVDEYQDQNKLPKSRQDHTRVRPSFNGTVFENFGAPASLGMNTTVPISRTYYAEWQVDPFASDDDDSLILVRALFGRQGTFGPYVASGLGTVDRLRVGASMLVEMVMKGVQVNIDELWLFVRVQPAERRPI